MVASDSRFVVKRFEAPLPVHENFKRTISQALDFCQHDYVQFVAADDHFGEASYFSDGILALTQNKESLIACGIVQAFTPEKMLESISFEGLAVQATAEKLLDLQSNLRFLSGSPLLLYFQESDGRIHTKPIFRLVVFPDC
jgi:hypothetical protein